MLLIFTNEHRRPRKSSASQHSSPVRPQPNQNLQPRPAVASLREWVIIRDVLGRRGRIRYENSKRVQLLHRRLRRERQFRGGVAESAHLFRVPWLYMGEASLGIERAYRSRILDQTVCKATGQHSCELASQCLEGKRPTRCWCEEGRGIGGRWKESPIQ